jgi:hypothetical protein
MTINTSPAPVGIYTTVYNSSTGLWNVVNGSGQIVGSSSTESGAQTFAVAQAQFDESLSNTATSPITNTGPRIETAPPPVSTTNNQVNAADTIASALPAERVDPAVYSPEFDKTTNTWNVVNQNGDLAAGGLTEQEAILFAQDQAFTDEGVTVPADSPVAAPTAGFASQADKNAAQISADLRNAQQQQTIASQRKGVNNGDWRVRLRLAPQSKYLYNASNPGILQPLQVTDGVIFPYTPSIDTTYRANYQQYDLTHSNYRGYFYQNSYVDAVNLKCTFTAQDTDEANYLLAVITFFKSVTKMFYGQDTERGAPPPLVFLTGLGEFQFNEHACLVQSFSYTLPESVDYIRSGSRQQVGLNLLNVRDRTSVSNNTLFGSLNRLANALLPKGAQQEPPGAPTLGANRPTYVPTKIDISITLLPVQTRSQVSKQFSLARFAKGDLIKGGFW